MHRFNTNTWFPALLIAIVCIIAASIGATDAARALMFRRTSVTTRVTDRMLVQQGGVTIGEYAYTIALPAAWRDRYLKSDRAALPSDQAEVVAVEYALIEPDRDPAPLFSLIAVPVDAWNDAEARGYYHGTAIAIRDGLVFAYVLPARRHDVSYSPIHTQMINDLPRVLASFRLQ